MPLAAQNFNTQLKAYSEVTFRQTTDDFITALENSFKHFGGCPQTLVIDNLRAAVKHPDWFDPELVPKLTSFCAHYGVTILPTRPYMPRHKGTVEAGVKYVQNNALKGRTLASVAEQNAFLGDWERRVADKRVLRRKPKRLIYDRAADSDPLRTAIVGGLNQNGSSGSLTGVPYLEVVPILRDVTSLRSNSQTTTSFFLFMKPVIVRDSQFAELKFMTSADAPLWGVSPRLHVSAPIMIRSADAGCRLRIDD